MIRPTRSPRGARLAALLLPVLALACAEPGRRERPRNVLWITIDTVRADHLGCYGYERPTSPHLDALAARGTRFDSAYSTAPWTLPSVVSMLTGELPSQHGIYRGNRVLSAEADSVPSRLRAAGWATAASISGRLLMSVSGIDRHFELWDESEAQGMDHVSTPGVVEQCRSWLRCFAEEERPFFLFAHLFDAHYRFRDHEGIDLVPTERDRLTGLEPYREVEEHRAELSAVDRALLSGLYDEEIRFADEGIGELVAELEALGLADSTLVLVTADHGEELLDRGWFGHTVTLYDELVHVPLVVAGPGIPAGVVVGENVSTKEVGPALAELAGAGEPGHATRLAALARGEARPADVPLFCEVDYEDLGNRQPKAKKRAVVRGRYKLIVDELAGRSELYDLESDPLERRNLAAERPELLGELSAELDALGRGGRGTFGTREIGGGELEVLEGLGYAGSDQPGAESPRGADARAPRAD